MTSNELVTVARLADFYEAILAEGTDPLEVAKHDFGELKRKAPDLVRFLRDSDRSDRDIGDWLFEFFGRYKASGMSLKNFAADELERLESGQTTIRGWQTIRGSAGHATKKSPAQLQREIDDALAGKSGADGYRVAYALVTRRDGKVVTVRAIVDAPRPLTLAEAEKWRRSWGKGSTAWIETMDGTFVPVKGAKRPATFTDDERPGDVHASLTR